MKALFSTSGHLYANANSEIGYESAEEPIIVTNAGYLKVDTQTVKVRRKKGRNDYQIIYVAGGCVEFIENNSLWSAEKGAIKIYKPNEPQMYTCHAKQKAEIYWIHFTGSDAQKLLSNCELDMNNIGFHHDIVLNFKKCIDELQVKRKNFDIYVNGLLTSLIAEIGRCCQSKYKDVSLIDRAIKIINTTYDKSWTVKELSDMCHLSEYRFLHKFKEQTGYPPMRYCTMVKMEQAKSVLMDTTMAIAEIAQMFGYDSPLYFSRVFKSYTGISPTDFRKHKK